MNFKGIVFLMNLLAAVCLLPGCQKADVQQVTNLNENRIEVVGHGGIGFQSLSNQLPHNSFTSIMKVIEAYQADGVEIDIQLSSDGLLFMYANERLETMTNGAGFLPDLHSEELSQMRYRNDFLVNTFTQEFLSPLDSVLDILSQRNRPPKVFLDIKTFPDAFSDKGFTEYMERMEEAITRTFTKYDATEWLFVESADVGFLLSLREKNPGLQLFLDAASFPEDISRAAQHRFYGIIAKNPDYIQTDNVSLLQQILSAYD